MADPISQAEARAQGLTHFFTGLPCRNGHTAVRYVSSGVCLQCIKNTRLRNHAQVSEKARARASAWYAANKERAAQGEKVRREVKKEQIYLQRKRSYISNRDTVLARTKEYQEANRPKIRERHRKAKADLLPYVVAAKLGLSVKVAPPELIEAKRLYVQLTRKLKEIQK